MLRTATSLVAKASSRLCCTMTTSPTIAAAELKELIKSSSVRVLDATYSPTNLTPGEFEERKLAGKFAELTKLYPNAEYAAEHIPGAVHFHNDIATFPCKFQKAALYEPALFEQYARLLGVNKSDAVVVYSRGMAGGMLFAARAWWLLKAYGHPSVRVLEGGIDAWKAAGGPTTDVPTTVATGDFTASAPCKKRLATFDELFVEGTCDGQQRNLLDARPPGQFSGEEPLAFPPNGAPGAHLKGAKNVAIPTLIANGQLKSGEELAKQLEAAGICAAKESITLCNAGTQASLLALALEKAGRTARVFNGSLVEVSRRQPSLISEKGE